MASSLSIRIGDVTFDHATYDAKGDVLYLHVGEPQAAFGSDDTPEGHIVRLHEDGSVIGLTLINAKHFLERDGELVVTVAEAQHLPASVFEPLLTA